MLLFVLGIVFVLLNVAIIGLVGALGSARLDVKKAHKELNDTQVLLGRIVILEQQREKLKELINVTFSEEQITLLANRVSNRCQTILDSEHQSALSKLN